MPQLEYPRGPGWDANVQGQDIRLITCFGYNILWHFFFRSRLVSLFYFETYGDDIGIWDNDKWEAAAAPVDGEHNASSSPHCPLLT